MKHPCEIMYQFSNGKIYGTTEGICRITGKQSIGVPFEKWVKDTFTDFAWLKPGTIISNEALFCFEEQSELLQAMTGRDKPQKFRTYTHIVEGGRWHVLSKAQKQEIYELLVSTDPEVCVISDSGQKHLVFKHRIGTWQFENETISRDIETLRQIKETADEMIRLKFSKDEIQTGKYAQWKILECGLAKWQELENIIKPRRGSAIFDLAVWLAQAPEKTESEGDNGN